MQAMINKLDARFDQTSPEQPKGILKNLSVRFPETVEDGNNSDEEKPERRSKPDKVGLDFQHIT